MIGNFGGLPGGSGPAQLWQEGHILGQPVVPPSKRWLAAAIDYPLLILLVPFMISFSLGSFAYGFPALLMFFNSCALQGTSGQSVGKMVAGIRIGTFVILPGTKNCYWAPVGVTPSVFRMLWHIVDIATLGLLIYLSANSQTFADRRASTFVLDESLPLMDCPPNCVPVQIS